jgi:hypothetical protein
MVCVYLGWACGLLDGGLAFSSIFIFRLPSTQLSFLSPVLKWRQRAANDPQKEKFWNLRHYGFYGVFIAVFFYFVNVNRRLWANPKEKRERDKCLRKIKTSFILFHDSWFCLEVEARTLSLSFSLFFARPSLRVCLSFIPVLFLNKFRCAIPFPLFLVVVLLLLLFFLFH